MSGLSNLKNLANLAQVAKNPQQSGNQVLKLPLSQVRSKPDQVRKQFKGIGELADSLLTEGQIQPIVVSPQGADGLYEIQKGERRWRACREAGLAIIEAIINVDEQSALDATAGELIENIQRDDLTPLEIAAALQTFVDAGWKKKDIAKRIAKPQSFVSMHLSLLKLPDIVEDLFHQGITRDPETLNNLRQLHELDSTKCTHLCASATEQGMSRVQSREALNALKKPATHTPAPAKTAKAKPRISVAPSPAVDWVAVNPAQLHIHVSVPIAGQRVPGKLLTDRVDTDPAFVWVQLTSLDVVRIAAIDVNLETLST